MPVLPQSDTQAQSQTIEQVAQKFMQENPEVIEALEVFGITPAEYERALRALHPPVTYTGYSTQPEK